MKKATPTFEQLEEEYTALLNNVRHASQGWTNAFNKRADAIKKNKAVYQEIEKLTNVPWQFIGVIHSLECGLRLDQHLHNGDSLQRRTVRVPAGRPTNHEGPFTFVESACDALNMKGLGNIKKEDWTLPRMCYELERYNGFGYRKYHPSVLSPYLWSGTNHYQKGKYVRDGVFSYDAVSQQSGAVPLLLLLMDEESKSEKVELTPKEVVQKSDKLRMFSRIRTACAFVIASITSLFSAENFLFTRDMVTSLSSYIPWGYLALTAVFLVVLWAISKYVEKKTIEDFKEGRYIPSGLVEDEAHSADEPEEEEGK